MFSLCTCGAILIGELSISRSFKYRESSRVRRRAFTSRSTFHGRFKYGSVMQWVLPCKIWFHGEPLTGPRCYAWGTRIFHPVMGKASGGAKSYFQRWFSVQDLTPHSTPRASKKFLCKLAQDPLVTSFLHGKFAAAPVDHSVSFAPPPLMCCLCS
jgi:hypothetical protein